MAIVQPDALSLLRGLPDLPAAKVQYAQASIDAKATATNLTSKVDAIDGTGEPFRL